MGRTKTLTALITEATSLVDDNFDNAQWVQWFNNAIDDITPALKLEAEIIVPRDELSGAFPLPDNYIKALSVTLPSGNELAPLRSTDRKSTGYRIAMGNIFVQGAPADEISLFYYRRPEYVATSGASEPIDMPDDCVRAVIYYACAQAMLREDETERYNNFLTEYSNARALAKSLQDSKRGSQTGAWVVIR